MKEIKLEGTMGEFINILSEAGAAMIALMENFYRSCGVSKVQFLALFYIDEHPKGTITLSALGEKMGVSRANITTLADRMESKDLIKREPSIKDRRSIDLYVTEKGKGFLEKIKPQKDAFIEDVFECFSEAEMRKAVEVLEKLKIRIQETNQNIRG